MSELPSVREFFRRLRAELPSTNSEDPILLLEFEGSTRGHYQSRIAVYDIDTEDLVKYRYTSEYTTYIDDWPLRNTNYQIQRIIRPTRSPVLSRNRPYALVQVRNTDD